MVVILIIVVITDNGPKDLMANIPIEANDIEALMANLSITCSINYSCHAELVSASLL